MANHLRERRERAGLTQKQLADEVGASRSMIRLLEAGYAPARSEVRGRVNQLLDELEAQERPAA